MNFHSNDAVWKFLRKHKGVKFNYGAKQLWHTWDRPREEVLLSKRVSLAFKMLRKNAVEKGVLTNGAELGIDGDWERGRVWLKKFRTDERAITLFRRTNSTSSDLVYTGEIVPGWNEDFTALWNEAMEDAHLREQERKAAPCFPSLYLLSWGVAQILAGPPKTRSGAPSKEARGFQRFLLDLEKDYNWSILCLQEFTASNGEVVTETPEGHKVFATPPCKGQRRLAIVVAAETLPFVIDGSFRVQMCS